MPDISMCDDKKCPFRKKCYRFRAMPNEYHQTYFAGSPRSSEQHCDYFWDITGYDRKRLRPLKDLMKKDEL